MLSVSAWTLRKMVRDREIGSVKLSPREVRFHEQDVLDWIKARHQPAVKPVETADPKENT